MLAIALLVSLGVSNEPSPAALHLTITGSIETSLTRALPDAGSALAAQVARLLRWRGDVVRNVHRGDELFVVYESVPQPELVAMRYSGMEIVLSAYRFADAEGVLRYYDDEGRLIEPVLRRSPLATYTQITETMQRGRGKRQHAGLDFKALEGTPITLPFAGTVARVNWSRRANGNCVEVALPDGKLVRFLHLARIAKGVRPGVRLAVGAAIGAVGNTGHSSAAHLHYEIRDHAGQPVDPLKLHGTARVSLPPASRGPFAVVSARDDALLGLAQARASRR